jgi:hypothetical protein
MEVGCLSFQMFANPFRIAAAVDDGNDGYALPGMCVEDGPWEGFADQSVEVSICFSVNSARDLQSLDISSKVAVEIFTSPDSFLS